jgi:hypothetical protein
MYSGFQPQVVGIYRAAYPVEHRRVFVFLRGIMLVFTPNFTPLSSNP